MHKHNLHREIQHCRYRPSHHNHNEAEEATGVEARVSQEEEVVLTMIMCRMRQIPQESQPQEKIHDLPHVVATGVEGEGGEEEEEVLIWL